MLSSTGKWRFIAMDSCEDAGNFCEIKFRIAISFEDPETDSNMKKIDVVIADDHQLFMEGIKLILKKDKRFKFEVIGQANNRSSLFALLAKEKPELLLLDLNLQESDGLAILADLRKRYKDLKIIVVTMFNDPKFAKMLFKQGVNGFILKKDGIGIFQEAISEVIQGKTYATPVLSNKNTTPEGYPILPNGRITYVNKFLKKYNLTKREYEILQLIAQALSNKEIASELYISDQTVSVHRKNIMRKVGVSSSAGLIKMAYDNCLV